MEKKKVVSRKALPMPSPVGITILGWLALDHWMAPAWAYGVCATLVGIWFIAWIAAFFTEEQVDPFHGG